MKKWKKIIVAAILVLAGLAVWHVNTPSYKQSQEYKKLVRIANMQEVRLAIVRQNEALNQIKKALEEKECQPKPK